MELPVRFVYTENGVEKTSVDENKRTNYIDDVNRKLQNRSEEETKKLQLIVDAIIKAVSQ